MYRLLRVISLAAVTLLGVGLLSTPASAYPVHGRPVSLKMVILPGYTKTPLPVEVYTNGAKQAAKSIVKAGAGKVKVSVSVRPARKIKLPSCNSDPNAQALIEKAIDQFPNTPDRANTIYTLVVPQNQWCGSLSGIAGTTYRSVKPTRVVVWVMTEAVVDGQQLDFPPDFQTATMSDTAMHEFGHVLGLDHAKSAECYTTSGTPVPLGVDCNVEEYGDPYDVMGTGPKLSYASARALATEHQVKARKLPKGDTVLTPVGPSRLFQVSSRFGSVYLEYIPGVGVTARTHDEMSTSLLRFGKYADGSPRFVMVASDSWAIPGGAQLMVVSMDAAGASLSFSRNTGQDSLGATPPPPDSANPVTPQPVDVTILSFGGLPEEADAIAASLGWTTQVVEEDGVPTVSPSWQPTPTTVGLVLIEGMVDSVVLTSANADAFQAASETYFTDVYPWDEPDFVDPWYEEELP